MTKPKSKGKASAKAPTPRKRKAAEPQGESTPKRATSARTARKGAQAPEGDDNDGEDDTLANEDAAGEEPAAEPSARGSRAGTAKSQAAQSEALSELARGAEPSAPHLSGDDSDDARDLNDVGPLHTSDDDEVGRRLCAARTQC